MNKLTLSVITISLSTFLTNNSMDERPTKRIRLETEDRNEDTKDIHEKFKEAIDTENLELMEKLLQEGINPNCMIKRYDNLSICYPALIYCISKKCDSKVIKLLLKYKADINLRSMDFFNHDCLLCAVSEGNIPITQILIQEGANVNTRDKFKYTCLDTAFFSGHLDRHTSFNLVKLLLQNGADPNLENDPYKKTSIGLANIKNRKDILDLFKQWQEETNKKILEETSPYMPPVLGNIVSEYVTGKLET